MAVVAAAVSACASSGGTAVAPQPASRPVQAVSHPLTMVARTVGYDPESAVYVRGMLPRVPAAGPNAPVPATAPTPTIPLSYYGGPVQTDPHVYLIWWGPSWNVAPGTAGTGDPLSVKAYAKGFMKAAQGSRWLNDVLQYTQSDGRPTGNPSTMLAGSWVDTDAEPPAAPTYAQLSAEALKAARHFSFVGPNANYVIFTPTGVAPVHYPNPWCAYHTYTYNLNDKLIPFTVMPYLTDQGAWCGAGSVNTPGKLDGVSIILGHEVAETLTDPWIYTPNTGIASPTAWDDANNEEIGDKCSWSGLVNNSLVGYYPTQPLWNNGRNGCRQIPSGIAVPITAETN